MKNKKIAIIVAIICAVIIIISAIVCATQWNQDYFVKFRYKFIEKTGLFYPQPEKIDDVDDIEESFTDITLPDSAKLIDYTVEKKENPSAEWIEIAPYDYYFLIEFDNDEAMESYLKSIEGWETVSTQDQYIDIVESFGHTAQDITSTHTSWRFVEFTNGRTLDGKLIHVLKNHNRILICS